MSIEMMLGVITGLLIGVVFILTAILHRLNNPKSPTISVKEFQRAQRESNKDIVSKQ